MEAKLEVEPGAAVDGQSLFPPGPASPMLYQLMRWNLRPVPFLLDNYYRYGESFSVRLPVGKLVFLSNPDDIKEVFTGSPDVFYAGEVNSLPLQAILGPQSLLTMDGTEHLRERKLMLPPFHGEAMRSYEEIITRATEESIKRWPKDGPFDLHSEMQEITLEVIMQAVFGIQDEAKKEVLAKRLKGLLDVTRFPPLIVISALLYLSPFKNFNPAKVLRDKVDRLVFEVIAERREASNLEKRDDILSMLVQTGYEDGEPISDAHIRDELMTLLLAGHETTATGLAWAFEQLLLNPDVLQRLKAELRDGGEEYLECVCYETLRLRPVVPAVGRRLKAPATVGNYHYPAGTVLAPCIVLTHRRPDIYPDPGAFKPERFMGKKPDTYSWIPFGGGVRRCIGASFALLEMRTVIKTVLESVDLALVRPEPQSAVRRNVTLSPRQGTPVRLIT